MTPYRELFVEVAESILRGALEAHKTATDPARPRRTDVESMLRSVLAEYGIGVEVMREPSCRETRVALFRSGDVLFDRTLPDELFEDDTHQLLDVLCRIADEATSWSGPHRRRRWE